jgi:hypothetical protein
MSGEGTDGATPLGRLLRNLHRRGCGREHRAMPAGARSGPEGGTMPAKTEKQRRFMGAELERKREGKKTQTDMSESELEKMASKPASKKKT